jgi:transglutaminase-like putative cysteine protease
MHFSVESTVSYTVPQRSTAILNIHVLRTPSQTVVEEVFTVEPRVRCEEFLSASGENRFVRLDTGAEKEITITYSAKVETSPEVISHARIEEVPVAKLDRAVIPYLFPSRYCQSDRLGRLATGQFGGIGQPFDQVVAIADWIHDNVEYIPGTTTSETSAFDTITQRAGVCRDFAHLGIALCRALSIPARYFTGYAYQLEPADFHACFEAYIGDRWFIFDPTRLAPLNGLVRIATGRDAADASIATIFGRMNSGGMTVACQSLNAEFSPWTQAANPGCGLSLEK